MFRSRLAVLSGPVVFGVVCVPATWIVVQLFSSHFDDTWNTQHTGLLLLLVSLTVVFAGASGFVGAWIAGRNMMAHAAALCALQIAIGIAVQLQSWGALPIWYHVSFFVLLIAGILLGARLRMLICRTA